MIKFTPLLLIVSFIFATPTYFISNPAALNLSNQPQGSLRFLMINPYVANNFLSLSSYKTNFYTDPDWDSIQKITMLNEIPDNGFRLDADVLVAPLEFYSHLFSITFAYHHLASSIIPKSIFDLALFGNDINRRYDLSGTTVNSIGYADGALGVCYPVINFSEATNTTNFLALKRINIGGRLHYQKGIFVTQTDSSYGYLLTTPSAILGQVKLQQTVASFGSSCFALDLGATVELQKQLSAGIAILNLNTGFNWTKDPKQYSVEVNIDSLSLQRLLDIDEMDSIIHADTSAHPISSFKTSIPPQILLHAAYQPIKMVTVSSYYHQYLQESKFIPDFSRALNFTVDFSPARFFAIGFSITTDLKNDFKIGNSLHLGIGGFGLNLSVNQKNGFINSAKGVDLGLSFGVNW
jgi:hypothetical protein